MPTKPKRSILTTVEQSGQSLVYPFPEEEYRKGLATLKNNKAAGIDDVLVEQLKHLGPRAHRWLHSMLNMCFTEKQDPQWRQSRIIVILKPGKDDLIPKSYVSAAYDTVNHRILIQKIFNTTRDSPLCSIIQNMLSSMIFYVELNNERSRWRKQKNGFPQGSLLSPVLFNIYTNDHSSTLERGVLSMQTIFVSRAQYPSFTEVEDALEEITQYYISNSLRAKSDKTKLPHSIYGTKRQKDR